MKDIILTGDRPTGKLHLGHYFGSLKNRLNLQEKTDNLFILIADTQVLNNDINKSANVKENTLSLMRDYLAIGIDPQKVTFILQSQISELFELSSYLGNITPLSLIMRNPTIKTENKTYNNSLNMGFLNYPISQTADIILFDANIVPVGLDQVPILQFANDVLLKFNHTFKINYFREITPLLSETPKVVGIDGSQKMSKSLNNAIFLSDNEIELKKKINSLYTDENHIKITDPGSVEGNVVFMFLDLVMNDTYKLNELKEHYQRGGLGDRFLKDLLFNEINSLISTFNYNTYSDNDLLDILKAGSLKAKDVAIQRMSEIKDIIFR